MTIKKMSLSAGLALLVLGGIVVFRIVRESSSPGSTLSGRSIRIGRVVWRLVDPANDASELLIDGTRVAYGSIEMHDKNGLLLGYCWSDGTEDAKLFMVDSTLSATNSIVWYDDIIIALKKGMPRFDSSKCGTFLDFYKAKAQRKLIDVCETEFARSIPGSPLAECAEERDNYILDADAMHFDFDQDVYVTRKINRYATVQDVVNESERLLMEIYGKDIVEERPWHVMDTNDCYLISGSLPDDMLGGVAQLKVRKRDGFVWVYYHGE